MKNQSGGHGIFYILIPITAIILAVVVNFILDNYYQKKLEKDTLEIINHIITREFDDVKLYKEMALKEYKDLGYDDNPDLLDMRLGHEYMVFIKFRPINDLKTFFNIFKIKWIDKDGNLNSDKNINEGMDRNTGVLTAKYIIYLNEYNEPVIEEYSADKEHELEEMEKLKYPNDVIVQEDNTTEDALLE